MPMNFPDMKSLIAAAKVHKFRQPEQSEPEDSYRTALADFVSKIDFIESQEIRNKRGWDRWNEKENLDTLRRVNKR